MNETETSLEPAPFWRRLAAMAYDSILVLSIWMVVAFLVLQMFGIENARTADGDAVALDPLYKNVLFSAMLISAWAFFGWFWTHSGQTLGMQAWRIRIVQNDGTSITAAQSGIRFILAIVSFVALGLGYLYILINSDKAAMHDKLSGTRMVRVALMEDQSGKQ
ncbi:MAG: RDD family protein [Gammaproteobacteria bacterium]|nr:RDD family protein [Gammaproteobacteria bacterium]